MQDNLISPDDPSSKETEAEKRWDELNSAGSTIFVSDEENRVISYDAAARLALDDLEDGGLYEALCNNSIDAHLVALSADRIVKSQMNEAIKDYYES